MLPIKKNIILTAILVTNIAIGYERNHSLLVCYGKLNPNQIIGYNYVVLESQYYSIYEIDKIKSQNDKVFAYISLGEINSNSIYINRLQPFSFGKNENWNSYYLNLKSPETNEVLLDIIQQTLQIGFDGMFFDNIDNFASYGPQSQQKEELLDLLKTIRTTYPNHLFIQNSGLELIEDTAHFVDALLMESIASNYSFDEKKYQLRNQSEFDEFAYKLKKINKKNHLPILIVEYADTIQLYESIEQRIKKLHFDYFIGHINLLTIPEFQK